MSIFWLIVAACLLVVSRTAPQRIKSTGVGEAVFGLCNIAMLACLGLAFFALFDTPARSTYGYAGPEDSTLPKVFLTFLGVGVTVWVAMAIMSRASRQKAASGDEFRSSQLTLNLDQGAGLVRLTRPDSVVVQPVPMNRLRIDVVHVTDGPSKQSLVTLSEAPLPELGGMLLSPEYITESTKVIYSGLVEGAVGRALARWRDSHPGIGQATGVVIRWKDASEGLLRFVRQQRTQGQAPAVELWKFGNGPYLYYLAIEADGNVVTAKGDHPSLAPHAALLRADSACLDTEVDGYRWTFGISAHQADALKKLQTKGLITLAHRPPST
jgi:hypothetical protein